MEAGYRGWLIADQLGGRSSEFSTQRNRKEIKRIERTEKMRCNRSTSIVVAVALATAFASSSRADEKSASESRLTGVFKIVGGERNGEKIPAEQLKDVTVRIAENALTTFDRDKKELYAATYKLDKSQTPWKIVMTARLAPEANTGAVGEKKADAQSMGLIAIEGDTIKLIYALPEGEAPKAFKTEDKQQMFLLERIEESADK
jgi:uncharacterized protein (TIGR03067 family)